MIGRTRDRADARPSGSMNPKDVHQSGGFCGERRASLGPARRSGAGDGVCGQRLTEAFPEAEYLGIDIASSPGGMYRRIVSDGRDGRWVQRPPRASANRVRLRAPAV